MSAAERDEPEVEATGFRASMNWLHTWTGVVLGTLLFAIFWTGTLSVFDKEIDRWMMPMTRLAPAPVQSLDALKPMAEHLAPGARQWFIFFPNHRDPTLLLRAVGGPKHANIVRHIDPASGRVLQDPETLGATDFFYPFHKELRIEFMMLGRWIVCLAGMAMLVLGFSGVIIHKKLFADFFTLRIVRKPQRTILDLHVLAGLLGLPFNVLMPAFSLIIITYLLLPTPGMVIYGGSPAAYLNDSFDNYFRKPAGKPGQLASLDAMTREASRRWDGETPRYIQITNPDDAASVVHFARALDYHVTAPSDSIDFDGTTGRIIHSTGPKPLMSVQRFISGVHVINFKNWPLRWLYYVLGLFGCGMIATGFLFWVQSRRKRHAKLGLRGADGVERLAIGSTTGIIVATAAYMIANRLLPLSLARRSDFEVWTFYVVWIGAFAHGWLRSKISAAWVEQLWAIAAGGVAAVALNAVTTGMSIPVALMGGQWAVAGADCVMLAGALAAAAAALKLSRRAATAKPAAWAMERPRA
jgi:uncharacterized iron-regulated membrane protein